jgi:hypothetical protein
MDRLEFCRKFAEIFASHGAPLVSMTTVANLPPVSTTTAANLPPVANFSTSFAIVVDTSGKFATGVNDAGGKQWEQLSNYLQLKINLKKNLSLCLLYYPKVSQRNKEKIF